MGFNIPDVHREIKKVQEPAWGERAEPWIDWGTGTGGKQLVGEVVVSFEGGRTGSMKRRSSGGSVHHIASMRANLEERLAQTRRTKSSSGSSRRAWRPWRQNPGPTSGERLQCKHAHTCRRTHWHACAFHAVVRIDFLTCLLAYPGPLPCAGSSVSWPCVF